MGPGLETLLILWTVFHALFVLFATMYKYSSLMENDTYMYENLFGNNRITFLLTVVPIIPEVLTFPLWIVKLIYFLINNTIKNIREHYKDFTKNLPQKPKKVKKEIVVAVDQDYINALKELNKEIPNIQA